MAFYSVRAAFYAIHRELAERVIRDVDGGSLVTMDVKDAALVRSAFGAVEVSPH
jgi:N-acetylglutamate synthase/N-acetylornithine aminotransferase